MVLATAAVALAVGVGSLVAVTWSELQGSVHHVALSSARVDGAVRSPGGQAPAAMVLDVRLPGGSTRVLVLHDAAGRAQVLSLPSHLALPPVAGRAVPLDRMAPGRPADLVDALQRLGVRVTRYIGLDLSRVPVASPVGRLLSGKASIAALIANPLDLDHVLAGIVHHLFLGPRTSLGDALELLRLQSCTPRPLPVARVGTVDIPAPDAATVLHQVLGRPPAGGCHSSVANLLAA